MSGGGIDPGAGLTLGSSTSPGVAATTPSDDEPVANVNDGLAAFEIEAVRSKGTMRADLAKRFIG